MNSTSIRQLRRKFILIAMLSFFVVILFTGGMTALSNQLSLRAQAGHVLDLIVQNDGVLPDPQQLGRHGSVASLSDLSPEFAYAARYFSVVFDKNGEAKDVNIGHIASVDERKAIAYAEAARESFSNSLTMSLLGLGMTDTFYYTVAEGHHGDEVVAFLDCSFQLEVNREVGWNTVIICATGMAGSFVIVLLLSKRAIKPEIENTRKQKQFITNASHELKTPLAVIRANTEVIEMLQGESEWTQSTMRQVDRMDGLVQNLVMIARAEEQEDRRSMDEIDVSKVVADSVAPFQALARQDKKELVCDLAENVRMVADASAIQQLCTLLVDNAIKYCDDEGRVVVEVASPRRDRVSLTVSNTFAEGKRAQFNRFFDRFYRDDESHSDEGGYGIGLSVAESICLRYGGSIKASWKGGMAIFSCLLKSA